MTTVQIIVDPILGNDSTGSPLDNNETKNFYRTIDGALNNLKKDNILYENLIININNGDVYLNLLNYKNIFISKNNNSCNLFINCKINKSINLQQIDLDINTTIILPNDTSNIDIPDVAAINILDFIFLHEDNSLNIKNENTSNDDTLNRPRRIFETNDICILENSNGFINLNNRDFQLVANASIIKIGHFDNIESTNNCQLVDITNNNAIYLSIGNSITEITNWKINPYLRNNIKKIKSNNWSDNSFDAFLGLIVFSIFTPIAPIVDAINGNWSMETTRDLNSLMNILAGKAFSLNENKKKLSNINKLSKLSNYKFSNQRVQFFINKTFNKLNSNIVHNTIKLSNLNIINNSPNFIDAVLSDSPLEIQDCNFDNVQLFNNNETEEISNYHVTLNHNSDLKNGSTFERVILIKSDYTHELYDGTIFLVDASNDNIKINVPTNVLENRNFKYKRIDNTNNKVTIITGKGIENKIEYNLKNKCWNKNLNGYKNLGKVEFIGYNEKLWKL